MSLKSLLDRIFPEEHISGRIYEMKIDYRRPTISFITIKTSGGLNGESVPYHVYFLGDIELRCGQSVNVRLKRRILGIPFLSMDLVRDGYLYWKAAEIKIQNKNK